MPEQDRERPERLGLIPAEPEEVAGTRCSGGRTFVGTRRWRPERERHAGLEARHTAAFCALFVDAAPHSLAFAGPTAVLGRTCPLAAGARGAALLRVRLRDTPWPHLALPTVAEVVVEEPLADAQAEAGEYVPPASLPSPPS